MSFRGSPKNRSRVPIDTKRVIIRESFGGVPVLLMPESMVPVFFIFILERFSAEHFGIFFGKENEEIIILGVIFWKRKQNLKIELFLGN